MQLSFTKLHGLGNDFVVIDNFDLAISLTPEQVQYLCDRHFGIGADGVILVQPSPRPECVAYMHYINSDGTLAEMCGNGIRCFAKFLVDNHYIEANQTTFMADTKRGPLSLTIIRDEKGNFSQARVDMDEPIFNPALVPTTLPESSSTITSNPCVQEELVSSPWGDFAFTCVSMGNPHAICFLEHPESLPDEWFNTAPHTLESFKLETIGAYFESHEAFPAKTNVEFIVIKNGELHMRVFERGCGETLACGTGACASLVAAVITQRSPRHNKVHLRGGILDIIWDSESNHVYMTGPAQQSFSGTVQL